MSKNTHLTIQHHITEALNPLPALTSRSLSLNELFFASNLPSLPTQFAVLSYL